jgi:hypothetical protein
MSQSAAAMAQETPQTQMEATLSQVKDQLTQATKQVTSSLQAAGKTATDGLKSTKETLSKGLETTGKHEVVFKDKDGNDYIVLPATGALAVGAAATAIGLFDKRIGLGLAALSLFFGKRVSIRQRNQNQSETTV